MKVTLVLVTALALAVAVAVAGAWLAWPRDPPIDAPVAPSKVERPLLRPLEMAAPPTVDLATQIKHPRKPAGTNVPALDTSEWARRLAAREGRRDLDAVIETFQESMQCHHYFDAMASLQATNNNPRNQDLTKLNLRALEYMDESMARRQAIIHRASALCAGSDRGAVERAYHLAMLDAALMGDPDAQTCFLRDGSDTRNWSPQEYRRLIGPRYGEYHRSFTNAGLERADPYVGFWALADFLRATGPDPLPSNTSEPLPDIVRIWEVSRLASLRAPPYMRSMLEDMLGSAAERALISPGDIERADAWAQATWEKEFSNQPQFDFGRYGACSPGGWH